MTRLLAALVVAVSLNACGSPAAKPGTGIQGMVTIGPTCPVERVSSPCPPRPLAATVVVRDSTGREVTRVNSAADGHFTVDLAPGTYALLGQGSGSFGLPRPIPTSATVVAGSYTAVNVQFDSGIR
jgi:hypothetical protein